MADVIQRARMLTDVDAAGGIGLCNVSTSWAALLDVLDDFMRVTYTHRCAKCGHVTRLDGGGISQAVFIALAALERELPKEKP